MNEIDELKAALAASQAREGAMRELVEVYAQRNHVANGHHASHVRECGQTTCQPARDVLLAAPESQSAAPGSREKPAEVCPDCPHPIADHVADSPMWGTPDRCLHDGCHCHRSRPQPAPPRLPRRGEAGGAEGKIRSGT